MINKPADPRSPERLAMNGEANPLMAAKHVQRGQIGGRGTPELSRSPETGGWQPVTSEEPPMEIPVLVALIKDAQVMRVSDAKRSKYGFYTLWGGNACHWRTHWMPLPPPPTGDQ